MRFQLRLKLRRTCLKRQVCMHHTCMTAGSIAILRSRRRHRSETAERTAGDRGPSGPSADSHADAERYVHTVHDLTFPIGDVAVGIGTHSLAGESPKGRFSPREAPSAAAARCSPEVESAIRCRAAPSHPSRTPCEVGPTTARHRRCPFSPSGQGIETCRSAL